MKNACLLLITFCISSFTIAVAQTNYAIKEYSDIQYYQTSSPDSSLTQLNLIIPEGVQNPPVFIWIGQGAWAYVNKEVEMNICREFAKKGIAVVSAQHRLSPALLGQQKRYEGIKHPEHVKDVAHAFKWVYDHAEEYTYDKDNIFIGGFSSGAHLTTLLAVDDRYLNSLGLSTNLIKAVIPVGGGYDVVEYKNLLKAEDPSMEENHINVVFGDTEEEQIDASPTTYIDNLNTPMMVIADSDTYPYHISFEAMIHDKGIDNVEFYNLHNYTHAELWRELGRSEPSIYRDLIVSYINKWRALSLKSNG